MCQFFRRVRVGAQLAVDCEHRDAVDDRPDIQRELLDVVAPHDSLALQLGERIDERLKRSLAVGVKLGIGPRALAHAAEHHAIVRRVAQREAHVSQPHRPEAVHSVPGVVPGTDQIRSESLKSVARDRRKER